MDRRSLLLASGAAAFSGMAPAFARASPPWTDALDARIDGAMRRMGTTPGIAVAAYTPRGRYVRAFGVTDVTTGERADVDTAFYIGSSTKPLTALALAVRAERGAIDLGASLARFAPEAPFPVSVRPELVTFRDLLSHRSGIACDPIGFRVAFSGQHDPATLWRLIAGAEPNADAPLGTFGYTNIGYNLATLLTDRHFAQPWQDMLDAELFRPAGMRRSSARMSTALARGWKVARPHVALPDGVRRIALEKTDGTMHSAGGVVMSASDAVRWLELMVEGGRIGGRRVVPEAAVLATRVPLARFAAEYGDYARQAYGLGWYHVPFRDTLMLQHFGGFAGIRAHVSYLPAERSGVAVFANNSTAGAAMIDVIADHIHDLAAGRGDAVAVFDKRMEEQVAARDRSLQRVREDRAARAARRWQLARPLDAYAGSYANAAFGEMQVSVRDDALEVRFGAMRAVAEPAAEAEAIRVELVPATGEKITFQPDGTLRYKGQVFTRA